MSLGEYLGLPDDTKKKVHRLYKGIRMLPDRFLTSDVQDIIKRDLGMADYQRLLFMLFQGGYLTRERDFGHRVLHTKTELAKSLNDNTLAADIMSKNKVMAGFPVSTRGRKAPKETLPEPKSHLRIVNADSKDFDDDGAAPDETLANDARESVDLPDLDETLEGLNESDVLMIKDLIVCLKVARQCFPKLSREQFLLTYIEGGRYGRD
jgi:hypothetical protein